MFKGIITEKERLCVCLMPEKSTVQRAVGKVGFKDSIEANLWALLGGKRGD